jgi:pimeloyl-ACP methyl ester carboxylesterase
MGDPLTSKLRSEARGEGRPLLLLHGIATDRRVMIESFEPAFARPDVPKGWRRVYVDLPGHGESPSDAAPISADGFLGALAAFARELGPGVAIAGYAYGAYLAQGLAAVLDGVSGLFLACPVVEPDFGMRTVPPRRVAVSESDLAFSSDPRERTAFVEIAVQQTRPVLETFQRVVHPANIGVDPVVRDGIRERYHTTGLQATMLRSFAAPVSIVCGRDDHWVGYADAVRLLQLLTQAELHVLPDCGHLLPIEKSAAFLGLFRGWLARLG